METLDPRTVVSWRLSSQQLAAPRLQTVKDIVGKLCGVQAQDYAWAKWSIGLRGRNVTEVMVERAIAGGDIVRTWAWRGTLHFVAAQDVGWITALLAPSIIAGNKRRYGQLDLDDRAFTTSNDVLKRILAGRQRLVRAQIANALEEAGISAEGQRAPYLLQRAALDGVICIGPSRGREATYVLIRDWIPESAATSRDEALARLAQGYFGGHGPATVQDFAWWSGLPAAEARAALASASASLIQVAVDGKEFWAGQKFEPSPEPAAHLLPPFDEYLLGYKDRTAMVDPTHAKRINPGGGMPRPAILLRGRAAGTWKRAFRGDLIAISIEPFQPLQGRAADLLGEAARRFGAFYAMPVRMAP